MRVLFLNQFYYPDIAATAQILADVCEALAASGHEVTVLAGTSRYRLPHRGLVPVAEAEEGTLPRHERHRGVEIRRVPVVGSGGPTGKPWQRLVRRAVAEASFSGGALVELLRLGRLPPSERPQVVVALSSPPLLLLLGRLARWQLRSPLLFWVQDVYPELLFALGALSAERPIGRLAAAVLPAVWRWLYRGVDAAVALDGAMADRLIRAGLPADRIQVIEHFADTEEIRPQPAARNRLRRSLPLGDGLVIGYAGNLGRGHDFDTVAQALQILAGPTAPAVTAGMQFVFIGDGEQKARLIAAVPPALQRRVHFLPPQARSELGDVLTIGDVGLVTLAPGLAGLMVPSKVYAQLAAGLPILYVGPPTGRVAELCATEPVGESVRNGDAVGLVAALVRLINDPERRRAFGRRARELAEQRYDRRIVAAQHESLLAAVCRRGQLGRPAEAERNRR